ncbi:MULTISPECIES: GlsB/YeaQ/YmgE family stress response membrane protein [Novosphingobium]|uniref:Putative membrane protein YeaQ/YmgE (Transglycosylase-associated protein family) n=1 Tax=Novosphingobium sediminicola TaxID=563162 RepID=A0A7W6CF69_9SPHN|nr:MULTISPECIES: GlsB/YeaQ/YmgE family stress response membrane protein [Novosphingobium]MBB3955424.1 putative membrane protein YeaQ/YmgE (transglycosylase-associated protein family) [Novosphingobium sediminicola]NOW46141.1 putative membrane protein YeaQ/YmgE (transglycosylase-associated protein family) [Novosphingobium sp. SG751A]
MGIIIWLLSGAFVGWLASLIMRRDGQQGFLGDMVVGIVGAFIGGLLFAGGTINDGVISLGTILVSVVGAVVLLAIVNLARRGSLR